MNPKFKLILLFLFFGFLSIPIFYKLGNQSLFPWDEAWYASIARNLLRNGQILDLQFNGEPYWDHPPLGFWLIALSFKLFGISELTARLPIAVLGLASLFLIYLIGKKMGNSWAGLTSSLILFSSRWFLIRARSANLDILLIFFELLIFYFVFNLKNKKELYLLWFIFSLSLLTKSVIAITLLPLILFSSLNFLKSKRKNLKKTLGIILLIFLIPLSFWYCFNILRYGYNFIFRNIFYIGLRKAEVSGLEFNTFTRTLLYFRSAIHKWYWPFLFSFFSSLLFIRKKTIQFLLIYFLLVSTPFLLSEKTEIWHLIPIIGPMSLLISFVAFEMIEKIFYKLKKIKLLIKVCFVIFVLIITLQSYSSYWPTIIDLQPSVSNEAKISLISKKYNLPLIVEDKTYLPTLVYYLDKNVELNYSRSLLEDYPKPFLFLINTRNLSEMKNYKILNSVGDYGLLLFE